MQRFDTRCQPVRNRTPDFITGPCQTDDVLSQRMSVFQLLGEISANVLLTITIKKSPVVPEICRWMVSEVRQFC